MWSFMHVLRMDLLCVYWFWNWDPESIDKQPAPPPKPYPFGPYLRPWQFLQNNSFSCSVQLVESNILLHIPHLKHDLWNLYPPATRSSAAYTDLPHFGHFGFSAGTKGILYDFYRLIEIKKIAKNKFQIELRLRIRTCMFS